MNLITRLALASLVSGIAACSTTQNVSLSRQVTDRPIKVVAQVADAGNSPEMDANLEAALLEQRLRLARKLPEGTRKDPDADVLVSYVDVWRWDLTMYLQSVTLKVHDARSGELLATSSWKDSALHGWRNAKEVVGGLVDETFSKLRRTSPTPR